MFVTESFLATWTPRSLSVLRIVAALLFLQHGTNKLLGFPGTLPAHLALFPGMMSAVIELVGGLLLLAGFYTRIVAFILSGEMAVAYWIAHAPRGAFPFANGGDLAVLFCFAFLYFAFAGGGPWSLDARRAHA